MRLKVYIKNIITGHVTRPVWPGTYWIKFTFMLVKSREDTMFEYDIINECLRYNKDLIRVALNTNIHKCMPFLKKYRSLLKSKNVYMCSVIRSIDYIINCIKQL